MAWSERQSRGGWVDDDQPAAFVGTVSRDILRVVLPDRREARVPFDSFGTGMTIWLSDRDHWQDGAPVSAADRAAIETQVRAAVASSGYAVTVERS